MTTVLVQEGTYHCPECLQPLHFEQAERPPLIGKHRPADGQLDERGFAIGTCPSSWCDRRGVRLKVRLRTVEVEELPPLEENPHATQNPNPAGAARLLDAPTD